MARKRKLTRGDRWLNAVSAARDAIEEINNGADELDIDRINTASGDLSTAMQELAEVKEEYQEWYDNMPEGLRDNSPTGEKLTTITEIDITDEVDLDISEAVRQAIETALEDIINVLDEAENAELPVGFGRD